MKKMFCLCAVLFLLSGCAKKDIEMKATCTLEENNVQTTTIMQAVNDEIHTQTITIDTSYKKLGLSKAKAESSAKRRAKDYEDRNGITYSYEIDKEKLSQQLILDLDQASSSDMADLEILTANKKANDFSLDKALETYEVQGFTCTKE